ncbi:MAG TPA: hypothetical protein VGQ02_11755 [Candidatus Limnocylindrales bacterium]|jgi:hypothetical protein|nr:hypothetical protein [Candidatus Limnocylindrales bacterium]
MRRIVLVCSTVALLLATAAAPALAAQPFKESGTQNYMFSFSSDCSGTGNRTTCHEAYLDVFPVAPDTSVVCLSMYTFAFNERTGRGRLISDESGCNETASSALDVIVSGDTLTATLSDTQVDLLSCNQRTCTDAGSVSVSASDSGSPVAKYTNRGSFRDGNCTFRFAVAGQTAQVTGTMTIDGTVLAEEGSANTEDYRVSEQCR